MLVLLALLLSLKNCEKNYFIVNFEHLKHFHMSTTQNSSGININIIITHLIKVDKKFQKHIASYLSSF